MLMCLLREMFTGTSRCYHSLLSIEDYYSAIVLLTNPVHLSRTDSYVQLIHTDVTQSQDESTTCKDLAKIINLNRKKYLSKSRKTLLTTRAKLCSHFYKKHDNSKTFNAMKISYLNLSCGQSNIFCTTNI